MNAYERGKGRGKPTHMSSAGLPPEAISYVQDRGLASEQFVARSLGALRRITEGLQSFDPLGDVTMPSGEIIEVKSAGRMFRYVNGGSKRPRSRAIVVRWRREDAPEIAGYVGVDDWRFGPPPEPRWKPIPCWYVLAAEVRPVDAAGEPADLSVSPAEAEAWDGTAEIQLASGEFVEVRDETADERRRRQWREAGARRRARLRELPVPLPWTDPDTAHRGLGNGGGGRPVVRHSVFCLLCGEPDPVHLPTCAGVTTSAPRLVDPYHPTRKDGEE